MGFKYNIKSREIHFLTFTVVDWADVFTRLEYKNIIVDSLKYCQDKKGLNLYGWCLMTNHIHLLADARPDFTLSDIFRDYKKFTSKAVVEEIIKTQESRKAWMLDRFYFNGKYNPKIKNYKFWQDGMHPKEVITKDFFNQKLEYIHNNPVKAG